MLLGGDEIARSQGGNNNGYCQDNEISWFDWELDDRQRAMLDFTKRLIAFRAAHPVFRRPQFLTGESPVGSGLPDSWWFRPDGRKMTRRDWGSDVRAVGLFLNGREIPARTPDGEPVVDDSFLILFNGHHEPVTYRLPPRRFGAHWQLEFSTAGPEPAEGTSFAPRDEVALEARSVTLLRRT
jgi:glycogen operon protein